MAKQRGNKTAKSSSPAASSFDSRRASPLGQALWYGSLFFGLLGIFYGAVHLKQIIDEQQAQAASGQSESHSPRDIIRPKQRDFLSRWDGVAVNHTRKLQLDDSGRIFTMRTLSLKPPIFELPDYLTEKEAAKIIEYAEMGGLRKSDSTFFDGSNLKDKDRTIDEIPEEEAKKLFRYSEQTWLPLDDDETLADLHRRAMTLMQVSPNVVSVENMQVVRYDKHGHYDCHFDTESDRNGPCCIDPEHSRDKFTGVDALELPLSKRCALCRFATILYFLIDTEEGGGTIFPLADMNEEQLRRWRNRHDYGKYTQTIDCAPGLAVPPKKLKAVLWYNHLIDEGHLGDIDVRSLHGGCHVKKGFKWIANHWFSALPPEHKRNRVATTHIADAHD